MSALLDWLEYRDDNRLMQTPPATTPNSSSNPQALLPTSVRLDQSTQFNPAASNFQPTQRSVAGYGSVPSCKVDKISSYNRRQRTNAQVHSYTSSTAHQVVQSIEPCGETQSTGKKSSTPPWRKRGRQGTTPLRSTPASDEPERPVTPPPEPVVSRIYQSRANNPLQSLPHAQKLLVVLDLNGTLLVRKKGDPQRMIKRPGVEFLLEYLFTKHVVMVCTSATARNARDMVQKLLTPDQVSRLITIRARDTLGLTPVQYASKVQVYKNLEDIWTDPLVINSIPYGAKSWSLANTVLIDDSILKAKAQPYNLIQVPEFEWAALGDRKHPPKEIIQEEVAIMKSVKKKLEELKYQANVACLIKQWQEGQNAAPGIVDEQVDQGKMTALKPIEPQSKNGAEDYPTPTSLDSNTSKSDSEGDYEPPETLAFRGRQHSNITITGNPPGLKDSKHTVKEGEEEYEPPENFNMLSLDELHDHARRRSVSPVTEGDFGWMKKQ